ncbi:MULTISPECIES: hypothetical protein [unclassified Streptomyces]|uniref:Porin family protein n=1 Tax=Streptomyces evansiae TaxID=3075535 RepID=A0ABD5E6W8_9ACTN|nr:MULTISPECIES: hypothetical protein [unclassified Streptomyces]ASY32338.1 hypothetical protein CAC01_06145 [Streptomyces sp. CLI2509]EFL03161.1 conserved hypothetical protein [Streptomyces sp. SPB78]EGJ74147.1 hypothetical protein STTU_1358 [Streptomyces sp. Tu6071]MDT0408247.1 hypothetical protein [Streptomyces sp. DSM 41979]MDT0416527.1 hypothetical protein [Streptomyces sp. DSM 41982]
MRLRTVFAATALAATAVLGGASLASANEGPSFVAGEAEYTHVDVNADYLNIGGPYGITKGHLDGSYTNGELGFVAAG